ncbi:nuclear transport factor 2 family protein [Sneathiella sp.]|uniref:nuclear transport factor 2 family protein n=1 Tax=Sneathiella sp. TaxID=1964365 RepID=UPI0025CE0F00|nr:nuclear transport factor 2 family protein [Sneathiella sp.]
MTETETRAILDAYYAALKSGDEARLREMVTEDITVEYHDSLGVLPWGGTWRGFEAFRTFLGRVGEHLVIDQVEPLQTLVSGEQVVVLLRGHWTAQSTGRKMEAVVANLFTMREGRVAGYQVFPDSAAFAMALDKIALR